MATVKVQRRLKSLEQHKLKSELDAYPQVIIHDSSNPDTADRGVEALRKKYSHAGALIVLPDNERDEEITVKVTKFGYWFEGM